MPTKKNLFTLLITYIFIALIQSCNTDQKNLKQESQNKTLTKEVNKEKDQWPNNGLRKKFKIDSSDFTIWASKESLSVRLEREESLENQISKIKKTLDKISKEADLNKLTQIGILPINNELLQNIASVPEIQKELKQKSTGGIVNSMGIVSPNAYKSSKLKKITSLFLTYHLEPYNYYIDKCRPEKIENDTLNSTLVCGSINFKLREIQQ